MNMEGSRDDLSLPLLGAGEAEEADRSTGEVVLDIDGSTTSSSQSASSGNGECARTQQSSSENPFDFLGVTFSLDQPTPLDPFRNHTHAIEGAYEWFKILVCIPIALLRLLLFGLSLLVGFLATKLALQGWKDRKNPMPKWRCRVMWVTRLSTRCILFCFGYHWIKRIGRPASREIAPIVVSNHVSYIEPIFFFYELFPTIVASESHDRLPFVGTIIRAMQVIYVDRFSASSRKHAVSEIKRKASCSSFPRVLLFPEGTTTNGRALISFQLGAFIPGFPIQPVAIRYPHVHFDQSWGHISLAKLMFRMFTQFHNFMEVEYLPVISPLVNRKENAVHLAERTRYAIASTLNIVQTSHSYGDLMLLSRASQLGKDKLSAYLVEMATVESSFNMSTLEALEFQDRFFAMNPDPSGRVKIHDFLRVLRLGFSGLSKKIFAFVDVEKRGSITFRQFLYGSALIMNQPSFQRTCTVAFEECDDEGKGYITKQQFGDAIRLAVVDMTDENVCELFKLFDIDNDESISREEFMSCLRKYPLLVAFFAPCTGHHNLLLFEAEEMANF